MIINLWTTPRTGSNWYAKYLTKVYPNFILISQYLNEYHLYNYMKPGHTDFLYAYEKGCSYKHFYFDYLKQCIATKIVLGPRTLDQNQEEEYRINLLQQHNKQKNPCIFYSHVKPMSERSYKKLLDIADKNIFLYRKDIRAQLSSYTLSYGTGQWKPTATKKVYKDIDVDPKIIDNLYDRICYWHSLDKENCQVIAYEDLDFASHKTNMPSKQNEVPSFDQLGQNTQNYIKLLESNFMTLKKTV